MSGERIRAAVTKEFRQFVRDPVLMSLVVWIFSFDIVICVTSLRLDLSEEPIAVLDFDHSAASLALADRLDRSSMFRVRFRPQDERTAAALLDRGEARLVAVVPRGYAERLDRDGGAGVQLLVDGSNSLLAQIALGQAQRLLMVDAARRLQTVPGTPSLPWIENRVRVWYNPGLRDTYSHVVSMIAIAAFMVGVILPAASLVREKERGTIEQLLVSPLQSAELLAAKATPTIIIGLLSLGPSMLLAWAFGVPLRGDPLTLTVVAATLLIAAVAMGVLVASVVRTLQQALLVTFFVLFPIIFLSGTMTPIESMTPALQLFSRLSPLRYYNDALLSIFLKGSGLADLWRQLAWMLGLGSALLGGSAVLFRRRLA